MYTSSSLILPEEISFVDSTQAITIKKRWFEYGRILQMVVAFVINICAGYVLYQLSFFNGRGILLAGIIAIGLVVCVIQVIGLWMLYKAICGFLNSTVIKVDHSSISIHFQPLPWFGAKTIKKDDIIQLAVVEKDYSDAVLNHVAYQLQIIVKNSAPIYLLHDLETPEQAQFIEQKIEQFLFENRR